MDRGGAEEKALEYIANRGREVGVELALLSDQTIEFSAGWVFFYNTRRYLEGGFVSDALAGNAPLIVSKRTGEVHVSGTARPIEEYIREFERAGH